MKKQLKAAIKAYINSKTTLEAYEAISDFVRLVETVPEFIKQAEDEGEKIQLNQIALNADKGWNYGLTGKDLELHNEYRNRKSEALHQLDPMFPLINLGNIRIGIQPENIADNSDWLFRWTAPDEPLRESDRKEFQTYLDKTYKKILPFLVKEDTTEIILPKEEPAKALSENISWENITIRFLNDYDVEIKNGSKISKADYTQMGFADERKNNEQETKAKESWKLLQYFSVSNNVFSLNASLKEKNKHKKRKQELSELLRDYFHIADDPILYDKAKKEYHLKIKLIPEKTFANQWQDRHIFEENSL